MKKALICDACGRVYRPRTSSLKCPFCISGTLEEYKKETKTPVSVNSIFGNNEAKDSKITIKEKLL